MRVLIVNPAMTVYGGAELVIVRLANCLAGRGMKCAVLTTEAAPQIAGDLDGVQILVEGHGTIFRKGSVPSEVAAIARGLHKHGKNFDVVNIHNFPAELAACASPRPVVWLCNEPPSVRLAPLAKSAVSLLKVRAILAADDFIVKRCVRRVVVADEENKARFRRLYGLDASIVRYGIDHEFFSVQGGDDRFNLSGSFNILHVGMLQPLKNQMRSLQALERLKDDIPSIRLVLAGDGDERYKAELREYCSGRGLHDRVVFTGHVEREEIRKLYYQCQVLLHPVHAQGGWLAPFEALCAGLPVIVSKELTAAEILRSEGLGTVTDGYENALLDVFTNYEHHRERARKGGEWVRKNLDWSAFCDRMIDIFRDACDEQDRATSRRSP